jgi:hypothetical protein
MITGARITSLTVDRRTPDNTLVDFVVGPEDAEVTESDTQRLTLGDFRRRLVNALVTEEPLGPVPRRATDLEAVQLHIGVRYLLLAPLYGYTLHELSVDREGSQLRLLHEGVEERYSVGALRARIRSHVREELDRLARPAARGAIELSRVAEAEAAAERGDQVRILELLGAWPAPLAIFLRTPDGQMLNNETRALIAKALGLLGSACISLGEMGKGEEVLRLGVQYAGDGSAAADIYLRLGEAMLWDSRPGESIAPLRRAANLGAAGDRVWPLLAQAFLARSRYVAAYSAIVEAREAGATPDSVSAVLEQLEAALGPSFRLWQKALENPAPPAA